MQTALKPDLTISAVRRDLAMAVDPVRLFSRLTDGGRNPGSILLESGDLAPRYAERSIGVIRPSLVVRGRESCFEVRALDVRGVEWLSRCTEGVARSASIQHRSSDCIRGTAPLDAAQSHQVQSARRSPHINVLRSLLPQELPEGFGDVPCGLYGHFAFDFVRQFESVPPAANDPFQEHDYQLFLSTRMFVVDHLTGRTTFVSLFPTSTDLDAGQRDIEGMEHAALDENVVALQPAISGPFVSDTPQEEFCDNVLRLQRAIRDGRAFQVVYGRTLQAPFRGDPLSAYRTLKQLNPSPYMFYVRDDRGTLLGASPELAVRVRQEADIRRVEIKPIAGTAPRGRLRGRIDAELDLRLETTLRTDAKELAEHAMLIDVARNDIASVAETGTTEVSEAFAIEKFSHVQHLVSRVSGVLRDDLDAFDAYTATMNMGTLTGAPKPEAMRLIAETERNARGVFGGGVGFVTAAGDMETAIVIRAMRILQDRVYVRAGAGIVADSIPEQEWEETARKASACLKAIQEGDQ